MTTNFPLNFFKFINPEFKEKLYTKDEIQNLYWMIAMQMTRDEITLMEYRFLMDKTPENMEKLFDGTWEYVKTAKDIENRLDEIRQKIRNDGSLIRKLERGKKEA